MRNFIGLTEAETGVWLLSVIVSIIAGHIGEGRNKKRELRWKYVFQHIDRARVFILVVVVVAAATAAAVSICWWECCINCIQNATLALLIAARKKNNYRMNVYHLRDVFTHKRTTCTLLFWTYEFSSTCRVAIFFKTFRTISCSFKKTHVLTSFAD